MTTKTPDPENIAARLLGRHCAGIAARPAPQVVLAYLETGCRQKGQTLRPIDFTVRSLLNCMSVPELLELLVDCRIEPSILSAHTQNLDVTNRPVLACLDQLCLPDAPAAPAGEETTAEAPAP